VLLLQPLFQCWDGRWHTCQQPVQLDTITLITLPRKTE
jgi:hypothetical protein